MHIHSHTFIHLPSPTAVRFCPPEWGLHSWWGHIKPVVRAIEISRAGSKDEFRWNPRSHHSWRFFIIRAKRVSNWYIPKKKPARVPVCRVHVSNNLGFSVWYYVPHTYVPGISSLSAGYQDTYMYLRTRNGRRRLSAAPPSTIVA